MSWTEKIKSIPPAGKYSQYGESAYINYIFENIRVTNKHFVDIGAMDGLQWSNTRHLLEYGWKGLMIDGAHENELVKKHFVTAENIINLLQQYNTPKEFDLLSIDIDGNDYHVLEKILSDYTPRVIISEFNAQFDDARAIKYDPEFVFKADEYYGYTYLAGMKLADWFGYKIIHQNSDLNLYYVKADLIVGDPQPEINIRKWWPVKSDKEWIML